MFFLVFALLFNERNFNVIFSISGRIMEVSTIQSNLNVDNWSHWNIKGKYFINLWYLFFMLADKHLIVWLNNYKKLNSCLANL